MTAFSAIYRSKSSHQYLSSFSSDTWIYDGEWSCALSVVTSHYNTCPDFDIIYTLTLNYLTKCHHLHYKTNPEIHNCLVFMDLEGWFHILVEVVYCVNKKGWLCSWDLGKMVIFVIFIKKKHDIRDATDPWSKNLKRPISSHCWQP